MLINIEKVSLGSGRSLSTLAFPDTTLPRSNGDKYKGYDGAAFIYFGARIYGWDVEEQTYYKLGREGLVFHGLQESLLLSKNPNYREAHEGANLSATSFYKEIGTGDVAQFKVFYQGKLYTHHTTDLKTKKKRILVSGGLKQ